MDYFYSIFQVCNFIIQWAVKASIAKRCVFFMAPLTKFNTYNKNPRHFRDRGWFAFWLSKHLLPYHFESPGWRESAWGEEQMSPAYSWYVKAFVTKAYGALFVFNSPGWRESARGEEQMPPAYFWYVKAFAMKHMVLYRQTGIICQGRTAIPSG